MNKIGIGVTTRNRPELITQCVEMIRKYSSPDKFIIVDDANSSMILKNVKKLFLVHYTE